mgnify:CR=1 FL=1
MINCNKILAKGSKCCFKEKKGLTMVEGVNIVSSK